MKQNQVRRVVVHGAENENLSELSGKVSAFHVQVIECRLRELALTTEQKIAVIDKIVENLQSKETNGFIQ